MQIYKWRQKKELAHPVSILHNPSGNPGASTAVTPTFRGEIDLGTTVQGKFGSDWDVSHFLKIILYSFLISISDYEYRKSMKK